ncbi:uncharacterized protein N7482_003426 [Penicillium canariense]|uniref:Pentatricopeptide repeat domain-containing protein n=1 Tax=Penicillium canariense TaxID=189055 RepID=A0A9W9LNM8_9EURO|nr:uncharacterized protein N7482_003426 [Penicillium canariense]KAJ5167832.1 hypothetical protein N7482_003426 [Penicillium canariense]
MLSRGRPCLRRHLSAALDAVAAGPDEPLLFLYPRWAASAVRRRRPISSLTPANTPLHSDVRPCTSTSPSFRRQSSRWITNATTTTQPDNGSGAELHAVEDVLEYNKDEGEGTKKPAASQDASRSALGSRETAGSVTDKPNQLHDLATKKLKEKSSNGSNLRPLTPGSRIRVPKSFLERNLSPRNRKQLRYGEFIIAKENRDDIPRNHLGSWFDVRDLLLRVHRQTRTGPKKVSKSKELLIPEETIALIYEGEYLVSSGSARMSGARSPPKEGNGLCRKVILTGSDRTLELVEDTIKQQQDLQASGDPLVEIQKPPFPILASTDTMRQLNLPVPVIRGVWASPADEQEPMSLNELLKNTPSLGSVKEFAEHIEEVINARRMNPVEKARDEAGVSHLERVAKHILRLFRQDSNRTIFSTAALNSALRFLYKHEFLSIARDVFSRAEHLATADSYNILLQNAASRQDKRMFQLFLQTMAQERIRPNADTWLALLQAMLTHKTKAAIIKDMAKKGYMKDTNTIRSSLQLTISDSFLVHLDGGRSVHSFFDLMVKTNGADWFTPSILGQLFNVASRLKNFAAMHELLDICTKYHLEMNSSCLTQVLYMVDDDIFTALEYTFKIMKRASFKLDGVALEKLFFIAFDGHHYNVCRVLWHYACMEGTVTFKMRSAVLDSLARNASLGTGSDDVSNIWSLSAGKVIVRGNTRSKYRLRQNRLTQLPAEFQDNPFLYLVSGYKSQGPERELQLRLAKTFVDRDIEIGAAYLKPQFSLAVMLEAAATMDQEWQGKPWPLTWMLQNAIEVPTKQRV